jgi:hypothetical protein
MKKFCSFLLSLFILSLTFGQAVGDKVEAYDIGTWYKATIKAVGAGVNQGQYLIDYDDYSTDRWHYAKDVRFVKAVKTQNTNSGPRSGKYGVLSYGSNSNPLRLGHFQLSAGSKYSFFDNGGGAVGSGTYTYDNVNKEVKWLSGPFNQYKWGGKFEITREGKTHSISLKRGTFGSNSTDSR